MSLRSIPSRDIYARLPEWPVFPETEMSSGGRVARSQIVFEGKSARLTVGMWEPMANLGRDTVLPGHEFMLVAAGEAGLVDETAETVGRAGIDSFGQVGNPGHHARLQGNIPSLRAPP